MGRVLDALEKQGLAKNTLVIFTSDNAGRYEGSVMRAGHRTNGELLGQKTDAWEGGHRVALVSRWPGHVPAGSERKELFHQVDLMATLAEAGGIKIPVKRSEAILHGTGSLVLRKDWWVFIPRQGSGGKTVPEPTKPFGLHYADMGFQNGDVDENGQIKPDTPKEQLYDLAKDLGQHSNLASSDPERLKAMRERFAELTKGYKPAAGAGE